MSFAREGWIFVLPLVAVAAVLIWLRRPGWASLVVLMALGVLLFFRVPHRPTASGSGTILAPANGRVTAVELMEEPAIGPGRYHRIVTFLSVFNVHVQRAPVSGTVILSRYTQGRKLAAFRPRAGEVNENHLVVIRQDDGRLVGVRQIAGLLARRVVCYLQEGDRVGRGDLMGLIKFGSRVDLYVPKEENILVEEGQRMIEGLTPVNGEGASP